ncbi:MAG: nitrilase-related carbon-nitrogen hydrolase [Rikenellaceae bacterium]
MIISLVQTSIEWLDPTTNRESAEGWIKKCRGSALCLLPEMFTTGFSMDPERSAAEGQRTVEWMAQMASRYQMAIGGSVAVCEDGTFRNRFYVVERCGRRGFYDKRHLFTFAGEHLKYQAGSRRVIVEIEGVKILLLVCYDLRFPVWARNGWAEEGAECGVGSGAEYDVVACVANWPKSRRGAWDTLLRARAIENLAYVCGVNRVGEDPSCAYSGGTVAIGYKGETIAAVEDNTEGIVKLNVDIEGLKAFRAKFPALRDADEFEIE